MMFVAWMLATATAPAAATGLQQQFDSATTALEAGQWESALTGFRSVEAVPGIGPRTRGVALLRQGSALIHLQRDQDAMEAYRKGLALVPKTDASLNDDRFDALIALGGLDRGYYDYAAAKGEFSEALALASDNAMKLKAMLPLAAASMFDDVKAARAVMDQAVALAASVKVSPQVDAAIRDTRGRVLLNQGEVAAALADLEIAVKDMGGLTEHTDIQDVIVRSDASLAALKARKEDKAREYLAMTGEGRLPDGPFATPADTKVPPCGGDIEPNDVVVVEFGIGDDGKVTFANPIYASRQGPIAVEFAKAVSHWAWRESDVKSIPLFYRAVTRIEMRCSTAVQRPGDADLLTPAFVSWMVEKGVHPPTAEELGDVALLRAGLERRKDAKPVDRLPYLLALSGHARLDYKQQDALIQQAAATVAEAQAPPAVRALFRIKLLEAARREGDAGMARFQAGIRAMLASPDIANDALAGNVIRLILAAPSRGGPPNDATELLQHVIDDKRLDAHDPMRVGAMVRLASLQAQRGDLSAARQTYLGTGLSAQQCALVDAQPAVRRMGVHNDDYPTDAVRWGIGGWTQIEFDIQADGTTVNRRATLAYPPFVFGESTAKAMAATRYTQTYRPDGATGCNGASTRVRYVIPKS